MRDLCVIRPNVITGFSGRKKNREPETETDMKFHSLKKIPN